MTLPNSSSLPGTWPDKSPEDTVRSGRGGKKEKKKTLMAKPSSKPGDNTSAQTLPYTPWTASCHGRLRLRPTFSPDASSVGSSVHSLLHGKCQNGNYSLRHVNVPQFLKSIIQIRL